MQHSLLKLAAVAVGAAMAASCGGSGGGGNQVLPTADNILPDVVPAGSTAGIEDYLQPGTGTWRINLDGQVEAVGYGTANLEGALVYDPDLDQWIINVDGQNLTLLPAGGTEYVTQDCTNCALFLTYDDDPATSQYGTFAYILYDTPTKTVEFFAHAGLKTASADMPASGTGTYAGTFWGLVNYTDADFGPWYDYIAGDATITANFTDTGGSVDFYSSGTGDIPGSIYEISGAATISGNSYQGTVAGFYDDLVTSNAPSLILDPTGAGSLLSGAFYGPNADETAGVVYATTDPDNPNWGELAGGFWAPKTP